jgi:opacity protein-like surface antigen
MTILINKNKDNITVFANQIVQGAISLYKTSIDFKYIYIVQSGEELYVLQEDKFVSGDLTISRNNFQGVLNIATAGFSSTNYPKISFNENQFVEIISAYNTSLGETATETNRYEKPIHFTILNLGSGAQHRQFEYFVQAMYRLYYPSISRSTSLNLGLNYFNYQTSNASVQIQQNLLNKNIRPYLFGGLSLSYLNVVDMNNRPINETGFQKNFGLGYLYGAGIEMDVFKKYMVKCEYRHEIFNHLILFGVGYNFSKLVHDKNYFE